MANTFFQFKQFTIHQDKCAMKVTTDACLFGSSIPLLIQQEKNLTVLDIGTGTGLLSLMLAQKNEKAIIDAVEIDKDAATQANENIAASAWASRITVSNSDIKEWSPERKYDVIISNPPFYEGELKSTDVQKNKAHHDEALLLTDLLKIIKLNLLPDGRFYLLLPYKRQEEAGKLFIKEALAITRTVLLRQTAVHNYFRVILEGKHISSINEANECREISIRDEQQVYTPAFVHLLKDYYLYL